MPTFADLGLRDELLRALDDEELEAPTALQESVIPALRRGGNLVARASSGAGKTLAYSLGVLDRLVPRDSEEAVGLRLMVLTPTAADAERVALSMVPYAHALGLQLAVPGTPWGTPVADAAITVATPRDIMEAVGSSALKLEEVEAVVMDGASSIVSLGDWEQVDALLELVPRDAQRVVISASLDESVEDLIERRVKRALRFPAEPAVADRREPRTSAGSIGYVVTTDREKLNLLARQLRMRQPGSAPPIIFCRTDDRAADLAEQLTVRGFVIGTTGDADADVAIAAAGLTRAELLEELGSDLGQTISFDVPADAANLLDRHAGDDDAVALIETRELAHLHEIARQAKLTARSTPPPGDLPSSAADLNSYRADIRNAILQEDLTAQMLVLEPLFDEFTAAEIAAAASALLRIRRLPAESVQPHEQPSKAAVADRSAPAGPAPVTWARLFVSVGERDEVRKGDLVGALAGEANIPGSKIGKIEIRDSFSIVEVQSEVADQVIRAVNGTTIKNRSVRVDYDRGGPTRRPPARGATARRTSRRPPGE
jgi:ATP-dependent RNA helicase DeaD